MEVYTGAQGTVMPPVQGSVHPMGQQLIVELHGCDPQKINDVDTVERVMINAADAANATIVAHKFHKFAPQGVSGAVIVAESHFAIHTWPEHGYCSVDIFTCGDRTNNHAGLEVIKQGLGATDYDIVTVQMRHNKKEQKTDTQIIKDHFKPAIKVSDATQTVFQESYAAFGGARMAIDVKEHLESYRSEFQQIDVYNTVSFGNMLVLDGIIMLTQYDNAAYHEMIAHVPLNTHPNPSRVLIVGGGDGGTLKEVLKHQSVQEVVLCEIDKDVISISKKYFPEFAESFNDPRVQVITQDAAQYIKTKNNYFDVICVDSSDFFGLAESLFRKEFYADMYAALTHDGIAATQSESMYYDRGFVARLHAQNKDMFAHASYYYTLVPTYPSGTIGFSFCSKKYAPSHTISADRIAVLGELEYYNKEIHHASFQLPQSVRKALKI